MFIVQMHRGGDSLSLRSLGQRGLVSLLAEDGHGDDPMLADLLLQELADDDAEFEEPSFDEDELTETED